MPSPAALKKVLITGAGTGFGNEVSMRLAERGFDVIAAVEVYGQMQILKRQAAARGVELTVVKLDVTHDGDRRKALDWGVEILVNNAGVGEGGATVDIPAENIHRQFEVNAPARCCSRRASPSRWPSAARAASSGSPRARA